MTPIERAIHIAGSQSDLARHCNVSSQAVQQWAALNRIPASRVLEIEMATNGQVTRYELRPDVFGDAPHHSTADYEVSLAAG